MKRTIQHTILLCLLLLATYAASAQTVVPFTSDRWAFSGPASEVVTYKGQEALRMQGGQAWLEDVEMLTGTIEFDIAFPLVRGFQGVRWRVQERTSFEEFYLRSHLSGMPDANQYNPVLNNNSSWQLYHGEGYSAPTVYSEDWMRVRIVLEEESGEVFIDGAHQFSFNMKGHLSAGGLGVYASQLNTAYFANFSYKDETLRISEAPPEFEKNASGTVMSWQTTSQISDVEQLSGTDFSGANLLQFEWSNVWAEERGITNLARATEGSARGALLARIDIRSSEDRVAPIRFGYSDRVDVYLNGMLLYKGDNTYLSRDYRYLGTIGQFDELPLWLKEGSNTLVFVVHEGFGGWGITASFPETDGISFSDGVVK